MFGKKVKFQFSQMDKAGWLHFKTDDGRAVEISHQEAEEALYFFGKRGLRTRLLYHLKEQEEKKQMQECLSKFILRGTEEF